MPSWLRTSLIAVMLLSCVVIGARVYLEFGQPSGDRDTFFARPTDGPKQLPAFTLNDLYGQPRSIQEWAGRPVLINFWATWCAPCRREIPLLQALHTEQGDTGLQVLGIAVDFQDDVERFVGEYGVSYENLVGQSDGMRVADQFGSAGQALPFTVLASGAGEILTVHVGELHPDDLATMTRVAVAHDAGGLDLVTARAQLAMP